MSGSSAAARRPATGGSGPDPLLPVRRAGGAGALDGFGQGGQGAAGVGHDPGGAQPPGVVRVDVDAGEADLGVLEQRLGRGREVGQARADGQDQVGLAGQVVGGRGALQADAAQLPPGALLDRALAGEGLGHRDPGRGGQGLQLRGGAGVDDPAAGDDERPLRLGEQPGHRLDLVGVGGGPADHPVALGEELGREVVGVRLDVLGQGEHHGTGVDRVGRHPMAWAGRSRLLGPGDAVEEAGPGAGRRR